ncbi:MAG: M14 family zinc carboxypeptidase [Bacteroidales bacterium]|nr:M14 family zinc carboxypeptidase [Bacteroidales bacterium]
MSRRKYILIIFLSGLFICAGAQEKAHNKKLFEELGKYGQAEVAFVYPGYDELTTIGRLIPVAKLDEGMVYCVLSASDIDAFLSLNLLYKVIPREASKAVESAMSVEEAMNWDLYPTYGQYDTIVHRLAGDYPFLCRVDTIGESVEGRLILALKISDNVHLDEDEPEVFFTANMHGDELQGFVLMLQLAEHLLMNAGNGESEQVLVDSLEIWINPLSNPDGTYHLGDTITYPTRANANGTDLNRNFPDPLNPSIVPDVENVAMINFMRNRNFVLSANLHAGYEVLNFPWDRWLSKIPADSVWFYNICRKYADTVHQHSVAAYMDSYNNGVVRGAVWYQILGGRQDFVTYELQGREVTIELDDTKETPAAQLPLLWDYNYRSFLGYLENAVYGIHGRVIDDNTGEALKAKIFINGHDKDSSHVYSDPQTGKFVRMLNPGTWDITVSASGYDTKVINEITIEERQQEALTVRLMTSTSLTDPLSENRLRIWPVPAADKITLEAGKFVGRKLNMNIFNRSGMLVHEMKDVFIDNYKLEIDISHLPPGYYIISITDQSGRNYSGRFIH